MADTIDFVNKNFGKKFIALSKYRDLPQLNKPENYSDKIKLIQGYYLKDSLFAALVDSVVHFVCDNHDWEVISEEEKSLSTEELMAKYKNANITPSENEEEIWCFWDDVLNVGLNNTQPGTGVVDEWIVRQTLLTGMCPLAWKYDTFSFKDKKIKLPSIMVNFPSESVRLVRNSMSWEDEEEVYIKNADNNEGGKEQRGEFDSIPAASGDSSGDEEGKYRRLYSISDNHSTYASFVVKYGWSPGDVAIKDKSGEFELFLSLYPNPPLEKCLPWLMMREALWSSDLQTIDSLINTLLVWFIGNEKKEPKMSVKDKSGKVIKGDFETAKEMLESLGMQKVLQFYLPYWIKPEFVTPPTDVLLDASKYIGASVELARCFGLLSSADGFIAGEPYAARIANIRKKVLTPFWRLVTSDIVRRNNGVLTTTPNRRYDPLPFVGREFRDYIRQAHISGEISSETYMRYMGIDPDVEKIRIKKEIFRGERELFDAMVPLRFKQGVVRNSEEAAAKEGGEDAPSEEDEEIKVSSSIGRPVGAKDSQKRRRKGVKKDE